MIDDYRAYWRKGWAVAANLFSGTARTPMFCNGFTAVESAKDFSLVISFDNHRKPDGREATVTVDLVATS